MCIATIAQAQSLLLSKWHVSPARLCARLVTPWKCQLRQHGETLHDNWNWSHTSEYNKAASHHRQDLELKLEDSKSQLDAKAHEAHALQQSLFKAQAELKDQEVLLQDCHAGTQQAENERWSPHLFRLHNVANAQIAAFVQSTSAILGVLLVNRVSSADIVSNAHTCHLSSCAPKTSFIFAEISATDIPPSAGCTCVSSLLMIWRD